jgi:hypothetical protein
MKTVFSQSIALRLYLILGLASRFGVSYLIARHWLVPIQDALLGVLLFTSAWTETRLYFHLQPAPKENVHALDPKLSQAVRTLVAHQQSVRQLFGNQKG